MSTHSDTEKIMIMSRCVDHAAHVAMIQRCENDIQAIWNAKDMIDKRIDGMKSWVIAGMGGLLVQVLIFVFNMFGKNI